MYFMVLFFQSHLYIAVWFVGLCAYYQVEDSNVHIFFMLNLQSCIPRSFCNNSLSAFVCINVVFIYDAYNKEAVLSPENRAMQQLFVAV